MKNNPEFQQIPTEKAKELFAKMREGADKFPDEEINQEEEGGQKITQKEGNVDEIPFRNGMSSFDEWQKKNEEIEDERAARRV